MADFTFKITDNSGAIKKATQQQILKALEMCGMLAEGYAALKCPVDTGRLRSSITHEVDADANMMIVGTNIDYAPYVEMGTGEYYEGGRRTPWVYQREDGAWVTTTGNRAQPFIKPSIAEHIKEYERVFRDELRPLNGK